MQDFAGRSVFFVRDTGRAMDFYRDTLGFDLDWTHEENGQPYVAQVSLFGLQVILNQAEAPEHERPGHGRLFVGLDDAQSALLLRHIAAKGICPAYTQWGAPTLVLFDLDRNELFFWLSDAGRAQWEQARGG